MRWARVGTFEVRLERCRNLDAYRAPPIQCRAQQNIRSRKRVPEDIGPAVVQDVGRDPHIFAVIVARRLRRDQVRAILQDVLETTSVPL